jgi:hypothetical protein
VRAHALEQLFVARRAGRIELRLVLVDPADGRTRDDAGAPTADEREAVRWLGVHLAREGPCATCAASACGSTRVAAGDASTNLRWAGRARGRLPGGARRGGDERAPPAAPKPWRRWCTSATATAR